MTVNRSISFWNQTWWSFPFDMTRANILLQSDDPFIYREPHGERDSLYAAIDVGRIFQLILGGVGCVGNLLCFIVLLKKSLRNYTNFLIVTQTIADLFASAFLILIASLRLAGFGYQRPISSERFGAFFCYFLYSHLPIFAFFAISTYNLTVISIERYLAVIKPMWYIAKFKRRRLYILTTIAWLLAPLMQIIISLDVQYKDGVCINVEYFASVYVGMAIFIWEYFLPASVMLFSFACVAHKLRKLNRISVAWFRDHDHLHIDDIHDDSSTTHSRKTRSRTSEREANQAWTNQTRPSPKNASADATSPSLPRTSQRPMINDHRLPGVMRPAIIRRKKTTKILFVIVLVYMVCWSPNQWAFVYHNLGGYLLIDGKVHLATIILATCNTCINPFILAFRYKIYQRGLMDLMRRSFRFGR